jgi:predicted nucleic-acid-binding protein
LKITADTNVLVRAVVGDDAAQSDLAKAVLREAELVALPITALCEFVWVLSQGYGINRQDISETIRVLINAANVVVNRPAADAGLALLTAGGDFADGVIAFEGQWLGANTFLSFDRKAVGLAKAQGLSAEILEPT